MKTYRVTWKDAFGEDVTDEFTASSATEAIHAAMEAVAILRTHPNLITRVLLNREP
jgi:hypothetical protein